VIRHFLKIIPFVLLVFFLGRFFFLQEPPVWPDEAIFADIARNIIIHGQQSTALWAGMIPGVEHFASWYPPLFFNLLAIWFRLFGFSIEHQRSLSLLIACLFMVSFYTFSYAFAKMNLTKKNFVNIAVMFTMISLAVDRNFLSSARINRPEVFLLLLLTICLFTFFKLLSVNSPKKQSVLLLVIGLAMSLGILTHFIYAIYLVTIVVFFWRFNLIKLLTRMSFLIGFLVPILLWGLLVFDKIPIVTSQIYQAIIVRANNPNWMSTVFLGNNLSLKLQYLCYFYIAIDFIIWSVKIRNKKYWCLWLLIVLSFVVAFLGKIQFYFVLFLPFIYFAGLLRIVETISFTRQNKLRKLSAFLPLFCLVTLVLLNVYGINQELGLLDNGKYSYEAYSEEILKHVPEKKTVLLSAIPDPYFAFPFGRNKLYEFPVLPITQADYRKILNGVDIILVNTPLDANVAGDFLFRYIRNNASQVVYLSAPNQYAIFVVDLRPRDQRN